MLVNVKEMAEKTKFVQFTTTLFEDFLQDKKNDIPILTNLSWIYELMSELPQSVSQFMISPKICKLTSEIVLKFED